ncbi:Cell division cycle protein, partial [Globisporangium splendens]
MATAPAYTRAQVDHCAFCTWYPSFEHVSIKSVVVTLPPAFVSLILADGVVLPDAQRSGSKQQLQLEQQQALQSVREQVEATLRRFKGKVFPKLNWSCPRDASWMLGTMQCVNFEDVFLLLKSSDFVVHDISEVYAGCTALDAIVPQSQQGEVSADEEVAAAVAVPVTRNGPEEVYLVLKKWCSFYDSMLFRCFVVNHSLVGVSQRNCDEYYAFLFDQQDHLCELIYSFFEKHFFRESTDGATKKQRAKSAIFPDADFIFDVYVDKQNRVYLLDINVFGAVTDTLLFTWDELLELREANTRSRNVSAGNDSDDDGEDAVQDVVDFRIVESEQAIRPNPLSGYRVPTDLVDHLAGGSGFEAFIEQVKRDNANVGDSDSSSDAHEEEEDDDDVVWGSDNDD